MVDCEEMSFLKYAPDFLKCFWDLASTDATTRCDACDTLLEHVENNNEEGGSNELEKYAINRLVKGLASSRECARQGFAACLLRLLGSRTTADDGKVASVLEILDSNTKVCRAHVAIRLYKKGNDSYFLLRNTHIQLTGSIRGAEERDFMFGKLFCYLAIMRSGIIRSDQELSSIIFDRLLVLQERKSWIREVGIARKTAY